MNGQPPDRRTQSVVHRLLTAVDRALAANQEVAAARAALDRLTEPRLRLVPDRVEPEPTEGRTR
jgi:hypothetical protein